MDIKQKIAEEFSKYAESYNNNARLQKSVAEKLSKILKQKISASSNILDIGSGTGFIAENLQHKNIIQSDVSFEMCNINKKFGKSLVADFDALPLKENQFDFATSSLALQWSLNLEKTFSEIRKIIKPSGNLIFTIFGKNTLQELSFSSNSAGIISSNKFFSLAEINKFLQNSGFKISQEISEKIKIEYSNILALLNSMKSIGAGVNLDENKKNLTKSQIKTISDIYKENYGKNFPATWEIFYITAEKI